MGRVLQLDERYARTYSALRLSREARAAVARTMARLQASGALPLPGDFAALRWPVGVAWAREAGSFSLWVLYTFDERFVTLHELRSTRPVRVDE